ncbi:MAG: DegT/DnrJ/EryC1/StrS family aminotransferase [Anaerolineae bacterium]
MIDKPAILGGSPLFEEFLPIVRPTLPNYKTVEARVAELFATGMVTKGKYLAEFERRVAEYLGVKHAVAVSSCTTGLLLSYQGLGLDGEVIVPSFTFMATVHPLALNGVTPVFVDVDAETWNIDPRRVVEAITPKTTAIVALHNFGNPADVEELVSIAETHGLKLVIDAAHGFGTLYKGEPVGRYGDAEVFSTSPTKLLVTGEGGVVATDDDELARKIRVGREYGNPGSYDSEFPGINARMQEFSAILGLEGLAMLEENAQRRNRLADRFRKRLGRLPGICFQKINSHNRSSYKDFSVAIDENAFGLSRDQLSEALRAEGVDSRKYYDPPVHLHTAYRDFLQRCQGKLPVTESLARRILSLPIYSHMDDDTVDRICLAVERIQLHAGDVRRSLTQEERS